MSLFGSIMNKIFHRGSPASQPAPEGASAPASPIPAPAPAAGPVGAPPPQAPAQPAQPVDVEAVLETMAQARGGGGNWRTSIVDLLKLLDLDSSLAARKGLAQELNVHVGADGSAEENEALSKAVWKALADNGGHVPASLKG